MCQRGPSVVKSRTQQECLVCLSLRDEARGTLDSNETEIRKPAHVCSFQLCYVWSGCTGGNNV